MRDAFSAQISLSGGSLRGGATFQVLAPGYNGNQAISSRLRSRVRPIYVVHTVWTPSARTFRIATGLSWTGKPKGLAAAGQQGENAAELAEPVDQVKVHDSDQQINGAVGAEVSDLGVHSANGSLLHADSALVSSEWRFGAGIWRDIMRRLPNYASDFADGLHPKAAASVFFLYFACLAPCIAFGGWVPTVHSFPSSRTFTL